MFTIDEPNIQQGLVISHVDSSLTPYNSKWLVLSPHTGECQLHHGSAKYTWLVMSLDDYRILHLGPGPYVVRFAD